jgi:hypothetical protein
MLAMPSAPAQPRGNLLGSIEARYGDSHPLEPVLRHRFLYRRNCDWMKAASFRLRATTQARHLWQKRKEQWRSIAHVLDRMEKSLSLEQRFYEEATKWGRETAHMSSPLQKMMHHSYQAILGMSAENPKSKRDIIRLMLRDMKDNHREWSLALSYLTQHNPINPKDYGRTDKINAAWVRWGEGEGLL